HALPVISDNGWVSPVSKAYPRAEYQCSVKAIRPALLCSLAASGKTGTGTFSAGPWSVAGLYTAEVAVVGDGPVVSTGTMVATPALPVGAVVGGVEHPAMMRTLAIKVTTTKLERARTNPF